MTRDFSESTTTYIENLSTLFGYRVVRDWRCGVRRVRVFDPYNRLMTKEQVKVTFNGKLPEIII